MAKKIYKPRLHETGTVITTKTPYGSTSDMLIDPNNYTLEDGNPVTVAENEVICKDDRGFYITFKNRVDSKLADPNRYANPKNRLNLVEKQQVAT
jgi:hypothetical protein